MQRIYQPADLQEAQMLLDMLASEGVHAHLAGASLLGAVGELPVLGLLALQVEDAQAQRALELIDAYNAASPIPGDEPESGPSVLLC